MNMEKFYQLAESYKRIDRFSGPEDRPPEDVFVDIPAAVPQAAPTTSTQPAPLESRKVDQRIRQVSQMAERQFVEQREKEVQYADEAARKVERDNVLIPYRIEQIKKANYQMAPPRKTVEVQTFPSSAAAPVPSAAEPYSLFSLCVALSRPRPRPTPAQCQFPKEQLYRPSDSPRTTPRNTSTVFPSRI